MGSIIVSRECKAAAEAYLRALGGDRVETEETREWIRGALQGDHMHEAVAQEFATFERRQAALTDYLGRRAREMTAVTQRIRESIEGERV